MRDVRIKPFVVRGPVSTWRSIFDFVEKEKVVAPHACSDTQIHRQNTMHDKHIALHFGDCMPQHLAEKEQAIASHVCWPKHTHTHVHTLKTSHHNQRCSGCGKTAIVSKAHLSVTWLLKSSVILNKALVPVAKQKIECTLTYAANNDQFQH